MAHPRPGGRRSYGQAGGCVSTYRADEWRPTNTRPPSRRSRSTGRKGSSLEVSRQAVHSLPLWVSRRPETLSAPNQGCSRISFHFRGWKTERMNVLGALEKNLPESPRGSQEKDRSLSHSWA